VTARNLASPFTNPNLGLAELLPLSALTGLPLGGNVVNALPGGTPVGAACLLAGPAVQQAAAQGYYPVHYTHLKLPTIYSV